jgi:hypothetical protein
LTYVLFANANPSANANTRLALVLSIVERGQLLIDGFEHTTIDKAQVDGHYYSDKAPGMSLMAVPAAKVFAMLRAARGQERAWLDETGKPTNAFRSLLYLVGIVASALPTAAAVAVLYLVALRLCGDPAGSLFAAVALGFATPMWGWATTFFGHASAGAFQFLALAVFLLLAGGAGRGRARAWDLLGGLLLGWSIVIELTAGPSAALIGLFRLYVARRDPLPTLVAAGIGGLAGVAPLLVYNLLAFGSPLKLGYGAVVGFEGMQQGFFGISLPSVPIIGEILFGQRRGLLWIAPVLVLAPMALWRLLVQPGQRALGILIVAIVVYYVLLNSSYFYWDGGASTGPRHITPILPFVCLPFCLLWRELNRWLLLGLLGLSVFTTLACVSVTMTAMAHINNPLVDFILPRFMAGDLKSAVLNRLQLLPGHLALAPMLLVWAVLGTITLRLQRSVAR